MTTFHAPHHRRTVPWLAGLAAATLLACGGSSDANHCPATPDAAAAAAAPRPVGRFGASSTFAAKCVTPRAGTVDRAGTLDDEKAWLRAWNDELYLWYDQVPAAILGALNDDVTYPTAIDYFDALKTDAATDRFHFWLGTAEWNKLSQSGTQAGYGAQWALLASRPPRKAVAVYTETGSEAELQGVLRGDEVVTVDGVDVANGTDVAALNEGLFPTVVGKPHTFELRPRGATATRTVTMTAQDVTFAPVPTVKTVAAGASTVGYILFNDHVATAERGLVNAVNTLRGAGIGDLVLDIRYNGGGFLAIASQLAYMIAGPGRTACQTFEKTIFSDKYPTNDPVTGDALVPTPFLGTTLGLSVQRGQALPHLDLPRVFVLTGSGTCSASESVINSLQGIGVTVIQVGGTTCGKPYGFYPQDNCGTTYFSIQFKGVNAKGFGDYGGGFTPGGSGAASPPGCLVPDDLGHALGDPSEAQLAAALVYRATGRCPPLSAASARALTARTANVVAVPKGPWRENRILVRP